GRVQSGERQAGEERQLGREEHAFTALAGALGHPCPGERSLVIPAEEKDEEPRYMIEGRHDQKAWSLERRLDLARIPGVVGCDEFIATPPPGAQEHTAGGVAAPAEDAGDPLALLSAPAELVADADADGDGVAGGEGQILKIP